MDAPKARTELRDAAEMVGMAMREDHPTLPIVLYTAYLDDAISERAREAGVTACIGKVEGIASLEREISALCLELVEH